VNSAPEMPYIPAQVHGILSGEEMFSRGRDERMDYLDRLAGA
jgi:hypothetical protein